MKYKTEMEDLDRKLVEYTNNDTSFQITSAYLLELASKAKNIFTRAKEQNSAYATCEPYFESKKASTTSVEAFR